MAAKKLMPAHKPTNGPIELPKIPTRNPGTTKFCQPAGTPFTRLAPQVCPRPYCHILYCRPPLMSLLAPPVTTVSPLRMPYPALRFP
eukprot:772728-Pyramimonas_sp.AAC.1